MDIRCLPNTLYIFSSNVLHIGKTIDIFLSHMKITWLWFTIQNFVDYLPKNLFMFQKIRTKIVANFSIAKAPINGLAFCY